MKITLLTVGKTDFKWLREGRDIYLSRLSHYVKFGLSELAELRNVSSLSRDEH